MSSATPGRISRWVAAGLAAGVLVAAFGWRLARPDLFAPRPIRVGILHSLTGTMAISEKPVVDAYLLAIDEINRSGGLLGRKVQPVVADGRSDWPTFAREADRLIRAERVCTVFGCWTSASRKTVKPIFEKQDHLLIYPVQYEGLEQSPNIVYTGAAPNQQIIPAVKWSFDHLGRRFFLVGSDYVFPRTANEIIKDQVAALNGEIAGEEYLLLGTNDVSRVVGQIRNARPSVILNTINGSTNVAFFRALRAAGITPDRVPTVSVSIAEEELRTINPRDMMGDYSAWNYFQSVDTKANRHFVSAFKARYGEHRVTSDPLEAAYFGTRLWAQAVREAGSDDVRDIRNAIRHQSLNAPEGIVSIDPETQHTWKTVRIGKIHGDGQFEIVWDSRKPVRPAPFPVSRYRSEWELFLSRLYQGWGGQWARMKDEG